MTTLYVVSDEFPYSFECYKCGIKSKIIQFLTDGLKEHFSFPHGAQRFRATSSWLRLEGTRPKLVLEGGELGTVEVCVIPGEVEVVVVALVGVVVPDGSVVLDVVVVALTGTILHIAAPDLETLEKGTTAT